MRLTMCITFTYGYLDAVLDVPDALGGPAHVLLEDGRLEQLLLEAAVGLAVVGTHLVLLFVTMNITFVSRLACMRHLSHF